MDEMRVKAKKEYLIELFYKYWMFILAFALMAIYLKMSGPMNNRSGDANSIWETIKSFPSGKIVPSYVLYKGFASVYPYVWLYQLSGFFGVSEFFFVKLFHSALFAYVSTVGLPYIAERALRIKPKQWRKALVVLVMFWLWRSNNSFTQIMVDLPSLAYFILLVNSAIKTFNPECKNRPVRHLYTGMLLGLNLCLSGQYSFAAYCVAVYIIIKSITIKSLWQKSKKWGEILCLVLMILSMFAVKKYDTFFAQSITDRLRSEGAWIPTGETWLQLQFFAHYIRYNGAAEFLEYRKLSIWKDFYGDQYDSVISMVDSGNIGLSAVDYLKMVAKYPFDFMFSYANHLFVAISPDGGRFVFTRLFCGYSLLFSAILSLKNRFKTLKDFLKPELLLGLSFLFAIAAPLIFHIEERYVMQIQGLIFTFGLLNESVWDSIKQYFLFKPIRPLESRPFPYTFVVYILFIIMLFVHMAALYDTLGIIPESVLFRLN